MNVAPWVIVDEKTRKPIKLSVDGYEFLSVFNSKQEALKVISKNTFDFDIDIVKATMSWEK